MKYRMLELGEQIRGTDEWRYRGAQEKRTWVTCKAFDGTPFNNEDCEVRRPVEEEPEKVDRCVGCQKPAQEPAVPGETVVFCHAGTVHSHCWHSKTRLERVALGWEEDPYSYSLNADSWGTKDRLGKTIFCGLPWGAVLGDAVDLTKPPPTPLPGPDMSGDDVAADLTPEDLRRLRSDHEGGA